MKRNIYQALRKWKQSKTRKPLILQGARQVGKTYILKSFAKTEYKSSLYLNFEEEFKLKQFFEEDLQPHRIIKQLEIYFNTEIIPNETLLIFDEIQECPNALNSLKYFNEKANSYHICAAGSLLGVTLANTKGFPVGQVNFLHLYPLQFMEFLESIGESKLQSYLQSLDSLHPLPAPFHDKLNQLLKLYLFIGGMPEAIKTYIDTEDFNAVRNVHQEILKSYYLDFSKHTTSANMIKISQVWNSIPSQLAKENKKFIYTVVRESARAREYEEALHWLVQAGIVHKIHHISTPKKPLNAYSDLNIFKLYLLDVGILGAHSHLEPAVIVDGDRLFQEFKGSYTENYVAQELMIAQEQLHYWTSEGTAEIDYILQMDKGIFPLEVKSGVSSKNRSLSVYIDKYAPTFGVRTSLMNLKKNDHILNIPLYLISEISRLIDLAIE